jgi:hypothetical protein
MTEQQSAKKVGLDKNIYTSQGYPLEASKPEKTAKRDL